jgi:hypothetical protein
VAGRVRRTVRSSRSIGCGLLGCRCRAVGERQPVAESLRRLIRRLAVERHQGRGHTWPAADLGPPATSHQRDFDLVVTPANSFVEAMHEHVESGLEI